MSLRRILAVAIATAAGLSASSARAGGLDELPDQNAQALGRGATFVAKADDPAALYYNVAGLARQRGTKLLLSTNLHFNTMYFARAGRYPDDPTDPQTPWGGKPYPVVEDKDTAFALPMIGVTSDLGTDRFTLGVGAFGPAATSRTFQLGVNGQPAPSRYDAIQSNSTLFFPTVGAAYRITPQIDIGLAGHLVYAGIKQLSVAYADLGTCKTAEDPRCDAEANLDASGLGYAASIGVLARPTSSFQIGAQVRSPSSVQATGTISSKLATGATLPPNDATIDLKLPWIARAGVRYIGMRKTYELYDIELDGTYEAWSSAHHDGPIATTKSFTGAGTTRIVSLHRWNDTFSLRLGGAYNHALSNDADGTILTVRAGAFYDSSATDSAYTRLDANTLAKVAGTVGLGIKTGAFSINLAYAAVTSMTRVVSDGEFRPPNGAKNGETVDAAGKPLPPVNNGEYRAFSHVLSIGIEVRFDAFSGKPRLPSYGDQEYEELNVPGQHPKEEPAKAAAAEIPSGQVVATSAPSPDPPPSPASDPPPVETAPPVVEAPKSPSPASSPRRASGGARRRSRR